MSKFSYSKANRVYQKIYAALAGSPPKTNSFHFQHIVATSLDTFVKENLTKFDSKSSINVLDVGCGTLPYKNYSGSNWNWVGLDIETNPFAKVKVSTTDKIWDITSDTFDLVLCTEVLEHSKFPESILSEIHRVLKSEGTLILTTPFIYPIHGAPNDFRRFTPHFYENQLFGFQIQSLKLNGGFGSTVTTLILNWIEYQCQKSESYSVIRATLMPFWLLLALILNSLAKVLDSIDKTDSLGTNILLTAKKY
jgi:ubiquinone/menaquinone biosynthesis C-methylase UbiE